MMGRAQINQWRASDSLFVSAYGVAHFGKGLFWRSSDVLLVLFLTEFCDVPARQAGLALGVALLSSAFADLVIARRLAARFRSTTGAAKVQLLGTVLCAVALVMISWTGSISTELRLPFVLITSLSFRLAYSLIDVPQNAMLGLATRNRAARTRLSSVRFIIGGAANLCVAGLVAMLVGGVDDPPSQTTISLFVIGLGLIAVVGAGFQMLVVLHRPERPAEAASSEPNRPPVCQTHSALILICVGVIVAATTPIFSSLAPYFAAYVLTSATASGVLMGATTLGGILSQPVWVWIAQRVTRQRAIEIASVIMASGALVFLGLGSLGVWPAASGGALFGVGLGGLSLTLWAGLADSSVSPHEGRALASAATLFAIFTFSSKTALASSIVLVGWVLSLHPYRLVPEDGLWPLLPIMCLLPVVGALACILLARQVGTPIPWRAS